jgi:nitroreductase
MNAKATPKTQCGFFEVLRSRRSIRAFLDRPVEEQKLRQILDAANSAPSAGDLQAYEIVVVRDTKIRAAPSRGALGQTFIAQAPVGLVFCANPQRSAGKYGRRGIQLYCVQDATIACAYAQLAATALGLGSVWIGAFDTAAVAQALGIGREWRPIALLPIGYPAESPEPTPRRTLNDLVHECTTAHGRPAGY